MSGRAEYNSDMIVADIVNANPDASAVLASFGLPCSSCAVAWTETLREGLAPHGLDASLVLAKLNRDAPRGEGQALRTDEK